MILKGHKARTKIDAKQLNGKISYEITATASPDVKFQNIVNEANVTLVRIRAIE